MAAVAGTPESALRAPDGSGRIDVGGGRRLFARWSGIGAGRWAKDVPLVVLEAGLTDTHRSWDPAFERIAPFAPVVAYDRAGRGESDPRPNPELPWTGSDIADEMMRLVRAIETERPIVVVGHSFGGLVMRLAAERFPDWVTGIVLVDASHEDAHDQYLQLLRGEARDEYARRIKTNPEGIDFEATCAQARTVGPLRGRPLTVLARGMAEPRPGWPPEAEVLAMWCGLQEQLASLSPTSRHIVAPRSGHYVHRAQPELVVEAVRRTAEEAARRHAAREARGMRVRCIVPDPSVTPPRPPRVLLLPRAGGPGWELPTVDHPRRGWIAASVASLARELEKRLGGRFTVLRHLHEDMAAGALEHVCVLEVQDASWAPPSGARWATPDELRELGPAALAGTPGAARELERWLDEHAGRAEVPAVRPPWERSGWVAAATAWADAEVERLGATRTGPPEQIKGAWCGSAILRIPTGSGPLYLKETYARPPGEGALLVAMAERHAHCLPEVVASGASGRRMLMRDFGRGRLQGLPVAAWEESAQRFALLQLDCAAHLDRWLAMGCEDRRPAALPDLFERQIADRSGVGTGTAMGLTDIELAGARSLLPELRRLCAALHASGIPPSLVQQDFREGNLAVGPQRDGVRTFVYYDWSDTVISHPFFSGIRMLDYIQQPYETALRGPSGAPSTVTFSAVAHRRYIRDAYLEPWTALLPAAQLREVFALARRLNPLWQAVRWWLELPYYEPASPWGAMMIATLPARVRGLVRSLSEPPPSA